MKITVSIGANCNLFMMDEGVCGRRMDYLVTNNRYVSTVCFNEIKGKKYVRECAVLPGSLPECISCLPKVNQQLMKGTGCIIRETCE